MKAKIKAMLPKWMLGGLRKTKNVVLSPYRRYREAKAKEVENQRLRTRYEQTYKEYAKTGIVPPDAYQLLTPVYVLTNGQLTEAMSNHIAQQHPAVPVRGTMSPVLPTLSADEFQHVITDLQTNGIHVLKYRLADDVCDDLLRYAQNTPCSPRADHLPPNQPAVPFDSHNPLGPTYWFDQQKLAELPIIQRFLTDPTALQLAQAYLGMEPIFNIHMMWWSTAFKTSPDAKSAQSFHFDLDRAKFLKIFFYLVDVHERNGPHVYVKKTHGAKKLPVLVPRRISDDEMYTHYPREDGIAVTGPRGTIILADTRGFHKGTPVVEGSRLMFELEYVCDRFGRSEPVIHLNEHFSPEFMAFAQEHPRLFCRFTTNTAAKTTADLNII